MLQSNHYNRNSQRMWIRIICLVCIAIWTSGCIHATATYRIVDNNDRVIQRLEGTAPGGDVATLVVYYGPDVPPSIASRVNNEDFVKATARLSREALLIALKTLIQ